MSLKLISADAFESPFAGAHSGDTYLLWGNGIRATIADMSDNISFIHGANNALLFEATTGPQYVIDSGQGTQLSSAFAAGQINVYGFQFDRTGSFTELFTTDSDLRASIRPDGHGGTLAGTGGTTIDFWGVANLDPSRLHGVNPTLHGMPA